MKKLKVLTMMLCMILLASCSPKKAEESEEATEDNASEPVQEEVYGSAMASISQSNESGVSGQVTFEDLGNQTVKISVEVSNLTPGDHALHLHQNGDCSAPDASSAGGHWNPTNKPHGKRGVGDYHKGDIGNILAGEDGKVSWTADVTGWTIGGPDSTNIVNKAVIIHAGPDDFVSQPAGAAGAKVACGVVILQ